MINNTVLPSVNCARNLGVIVDCHLKFDAHISLIVRKAMLRSRLILKCFSSRNKDLMMKAFFTYVRQILEYCSPVWSPHLKYLIDRIESVQKNFTKRLPGLWNVPYPKRLELLKLQSLEYRRISYDLRLCYQSLHGYCDTTITSCLTYRSVDNTRSNRCKLFKHSCLIDATKFYFTNRIFNNSLPQHVVSAPTLSCFCNRLSKIDLNGKFCVIY